jgi:hypothetical protein
VIYIIGSYFLNAKMFKVHKIKMWSVVSHVNGGIQLQVSAIEVLRKIFGHADCEVSGSLGF